MSSEPQPVREADPADRPAQPDGAAASPLFSLVIPMKNEAGNVASVIGECVAAARPLGAFEIWVTDDGSTDDTADRLAALQSEIPELGVVTHRVSAGQSAAMASAIRAAEAPVICTLDGDGQNPPDQIGKLLGPFLAADVDPRLGLVAGQRATRQDTMGKRVASRLANGIRARILHDGTRDTGCGLKAFRRDAYLALPYFNHMHRYLPALFQRDGWTIRHVDVAHRERHAGQSNYTNIGRALVGVSDLAGVAWLIRRRRQIAPSEIALSPRKGAR